MFKTGHALPLVGTRFLRPRSSRGESAEQPREVCGSWPQARIIREPDSAAIRTPAQPVHVHEQSMSAFSPRPQSRPRSICELDHAWASTVREPAAATGLNCPQTVRRLELCAAANSPCPRAVRKREPVKNYPSHCIAVSILPPINFPVHVRIIPAHVLI